MYTKRMRSIQQWAALLLIAVSFSFGKRGQADLQPSPPPATNHPQLEIDLRKIGYETHKDPSAFLRMSTDFTDDNHLAIAWLTTDKRTVTTPVERTELHVLILDATTGKRAGLQSYPTPSGAVRFAGVPNAKFLICTGGLLRLFSQSFEELRGQSLGNDHACNGNLRGEGFSPSRKSFLLSMYSAPGQRADSLLNLETFAVTSEWAETCRVLSTSDHWLAGRCGKPNDRQISIRALDRVWKPFQAGSNPGTIAFVADDMLAVGAKSEVAVASTEGKTLSRAPLKPHNFALRFATSLSGSRFAVTEGKLRGLRSEPLDMYPFFSEDRVSVYSLSDRRTIYVVNVKGTSPWTPWDLHVNHVSLSPDGTLLAVVSNNVLRVYRLPASQ
jgi:hypothetical protein